MADEIEPVVPAVPEVKTFTQADLDGIVQARVGKVNAKAQESITAKEAQLTEALEKVADFERIVQEKKAESMSESEHIDALKVALKAEQDEKLELKNQITLGEQSRIEARFDNTDKEAILELDGMPKYIDFLLGQLKQNRVIENGEVFYKDSAGAVTDKKVLIDAIAAANPELFISGRLITA